MKNQEVMIVQKNIAETEKEYAHTEIYFNGVYIGYIIRNKSVAARIGEEWNFVSKHMSFASTFGNTRKSLLATITDLCYTNENNK